jgi:hypothetical protein
LKKIYNRIKMNNYWNISAVKRWWCSNLRAVQLQPDDAPPIWGRGLHGSLPHHIMGESVLCGIARGLPQTALLQSKGEEGISCLVVGG